MSLDKLAREAFINASEHGFHDDYKFDDISWQLMKLALVHSEVSELLEALRKDKGEDEIMSEFADIVIRLGDFYHALWVEGIVKKSLDEAVESKMAVNKARPHMHGRKA